MEQLRLLCSMSKKRLGTKEGKMHGREGVWLHDALREIVSGERACKMNGCNLVYVNSGLSLRGSWSIR